MRKRQKKKNDKKVWYNIKKQYGSKRNKKFGTGKKDLECIEMLKAGEFGQYTNIRIIMDTPPEQLKPFKVHWIKQ